MPIQGDLPLNTGPGFDPYLAIWAHTPDLAQIAQNGLFWGISAKYPDLGQNGLFRGYPGFGHFGVKFGPPFEPPLESHI